MKSFILGFMTGIYVSTIYDVKPYVEIAERETIKKLHSVNEYVKQRYENVDKKEFIEKFSNENQPK